MLRSEDAVIPMADKFEQVTFLIGDAQRLAMLNKVPAYKPFAPEIMGFIDAFSQYLFQLPDVKQWSDVASLAFWCRPASLRQMQSRYAGLEHRLGRGAAFHIAPANVAVNFAYSLLVGLLAGNANVVRLPGKDFVQISMICTALRQALNDHPHIAPYIVLVRYDKQKYVNDALSLLCQTRLIWGGNNTIAMLRQSPLGPRALDITFANRHSFCVIGAQGYLDAVNKERIASDFYNDTLHSDQNACSSPGLVVWLGENAEIREQAQRIFWKHFDRIVQERYTLQAASAVQKLTQFCLLSAQVDGVKRYPLSHNRLMRVELPALSSESLSHSGTCGYFLEYQINTLCEILPLCSGTCQTLSYYGMESAALAEFIMAYRPAGVDRLVEIGQALQFTLQWDGFDLIYMLTRIVNV